MKTFTNKSNARRSAITTIAKQKNLGKDIVKANLDQLVTIGQFEDGFMFVATRDMDDVITELQAHEIADEIADEIAAVEEIFESNEDLEDKLEAALNFNDKIMAFDLASGKDETVVIEVTQTNWSSEPDFKEQAIEHLLARLGNFKPRTFGNVTKY